MADPALQEQVDALFAQWNRRGSPGCALGVMRDGELIYRQGYGLANLEYDVPITPSTIFHVASMAKQFTAMAVALLGSAGQLALDDDIRQHLPDLPDYGETITIRHLVHHTSGLGSDLLWLLVAGWRLEDVITNADVLALVKRQRGLTYRPGDKLVYSGIGYLLLAEVVAQVSGQPFADFCREQIFRPLGMAHTHFQDDYLRVVKNRAYAYYPAGDGQYQNAILTCSLVGGTGLYTNVEDLALWDENFYTGKVGGQPLVEQMHQRGVLNNGEEIDYAFGLILDEDNGRNLVVHGGDGAGIHCYMLRAPGEHFSVAVLGNYAALNARQLARQVADIYLDGRAPATAPEAGAGPATAAGTGPEVEGTRAVAVPTPDGLRAYSGRYHSPELDVTWTISVAGDQLFVQRKRQGHSPLTATGVDVFSDGWLGQILHAPVKPLTLAFERDVDGVISGFHLSDSGGMLGKLAFIKQEG